MTALETARPSLTLLGGLGLQPGFRPVWKELLAQALSRPAPRMLILLLMAAEHKPAIEQRARIAEETFTQLGIDTETLQYPTAPPGAASLPPEPDGVFVMAGEKPVLLPDTLWRWHENGASLIASASVAVALGQYTFTPLRPYPSTLDALGLDLQAGAGVLPGAAVLPYFEHFPPGLLDKLQTVFPPGTALIGIGEQAALVSGADSWRVAGLGSVTILSHNQLAWVAQSGASIPGDLLPLYK